MSCKELQEEELEVLRSIYDGDENFKEVNETTFQYKVGDDQHFKSFLVELIWGENYPEELPEVNLDAFYNKNLSDDVKSYIIKELKEQAELLISEAMTYTLFEWSKENADELTINQTEPAVQGIIETKHEDPGADVGKPKVKKEHLSKQQKRRQYDRLDNKGERPRGHDWVDIVKHLSQTGGKHN